MSSVFTHPKPEGGRAEPCPHTRVWVSCEEDGYVGQCVKCAAWGAKRESYEEAKLAFDEAWGTKA
jgi:hypothetical protein